MKFSNIDGFCAVAGDLLANETVDSMKTFNHHGTLTTHYHSTYVAFRVYENCTRLGISGKKTSEITRAALLHDLYLYDWHIVKHDEYHIWYHPKEAVKNIEEKLFALTDMQRDMILRHMSPAGGVPNSIGGWLLTLNDKYCATIELLGLSDGFIPYYEAIENKVKNNAQNNM